MKRSFLVVALTLMSLSLLQAKDFYDTMPDTQRLMLAESYRAVAERFLELGDESRAEEYLTMATTLEDSLGKRSRRRRSTKASKKRSSRKVIINSENLPKSLDDCQDTSSFTDEEIIVDLFKRYFGGLLYGNMPLLLSSTSEYLLLPNYQRALNKQNQAKFYQEFLGSYNLALHNANEIYDFASLTLLLFSDTKALIKINSAEKAPLELKKWSYWSLFWHNTHYYFFEKIANEWQLVAFEIDYD